MPAERILILGESGSGKSTSLRNLNPTETFIINCISKSLPFKGWKSKYTRLSKDNPTGNLFNSSNASSILQTMQYVNDKRPEIKVLILDDLGYVGAYELFDKIKQVGYEKFTNIALNFKKIATLPESFRDDLCVFYILHPDTSTDVEGNKIIKSKIAGAMVEKQLNFEGLFEKVLYARPRRMNNKTEFGFEVITDGTSPAKTPLGMFEEEFIPNDLLFVKNAIESFGD